MAVATDIARRSRCTRAQVGAVIVDADNRIIASGYNGPPATMPTHDGTCAMYCPRSERVADPIGYTDCYAIHAEANALLFCDRRDREGGTVYVSGAICFTCAKLIANSGLSRAVMMVKQGDMHRNPSEVALYMESCDITVEVQR